MGKNHRPKYRLLIFLFFLAFLTISASQNSNGVNDQQITPRAVEELNVDIFIWQEGKTRTNILDADSAGDAIEIDASEDIFVEYNISYGGTYSLNVSHIRVTFTYMDFEFPPYEADVSELSASRGIIVNPGDSINNIGDPEIINLHEEDILLDVDRISVGTFELIAELIGTEIVSSRTSDESISPRTPDEETLWGPQTFYIHLEGNPLLTVVGAVAAVATVIAAVGTVGLVTSGAGPSSASSLSGSQPFGMDNTFVQAIAKGTDISARKIAGASRHIIANRCGSCWMEVPYDAKFCIACGVGLTTVIALKMKKFREAIAKLIERQKENPEAEITPEKVSQDTGMSEEMAKDAIQAMVNKDLLEGEKMKKKRISAKSFARFGASLTFSILLWAQLLGYLPMPSFYWVIAWVAGATIFFALFGGFIARRAAEATYRRVKREKCPECGKLVDPEWTHCHKCGTTLPFAAAPAEAAVVEEEEAVVEEEVEEEEAVVEEEVEEEEAVVEEEVEE
ncbi:MAG: zinc ribbon domain-containing protein, partial [Candidatus Hodarchaeota archaeon]